MLTWQRAVKKSAISELTIIIYIYIYDTFMLNTVPYEKKYHTVWGLAEANYVTCRYMYVRYDLNYGVTRSRFLDEHFFFYNLSQTINSLKDILKRPLTLLGLLFEGQAPSAWCKMWDRLRLNNFCSILFDKVLTSDWCPDLSTFGISIFDPNPHS